MKIIINAPDGASRADLIGAVKAASLAVESGIFEREPGSVIGIALGESQEITFGVVRRKKAISVYLSERGE